MSFSESTRAALTHNLAFEAGAGGLVTLTADVYRELVMAARNWEGYYSGPFAIDPGPPRNALGQMLDGISFAYETAFEDSAG